MGLMLLLAALLGKPAPDFHLQDARGKAVNLAQYRGKVVVVDFWATWCHGCKEEIPWFMEFQRKYKRRGLEVIGVSMDDDGWKSVTPYAREKRINYRLVIGNEAMARQYGLGEMPMTVLIGRDGKVLSCHPGIVDKDAFEKELRDAI